MPIAAPLIIGGASLASGIIGANAASKASDAQAQAAANALAFQQQVYQQNQQNLQPYMQAGTNALGQLSQIYGPNGVTQQGTQAFQNSPDYQFAQQQGNLALTRYENASGMGLSGGALKDIANYNQGLASQQFGNYFNRLMSLSQLGQGAASSLAGNNTNMSGQIGNTMQGIGQAQASGIVGGSNAITGALNSGISNSLLYNYINKMPGQNNPSGYQPLNLGNPGGTGGILGGLS